MRGVGGHEAAWRAPLAMTWEGGPHPAHTGWKWSLRQGSSGNDEMEQGFQAHSGISKGPQSPGVGAKATCSGGGRKRLAK